MSDSYKIVIESCDHEDIVLNPSKEQYETIVAAGLELLKKDYQTQVRAGLELLLESAVKYAVEEEERSKL